MGNSVGSIDVVGWCKDSSSINNGLVFSTIKSTVLSTVESTVLVLSVIKSVVLDSNRWSYSVVNFVYVDNFGYLYNNRGWNMYWDRFVHFDWNRVWYLNSDWLWYPDVYWFIVRYIHGVFNWYWVWFFDWNSYSDMNWHWDRAWNLNGVRPVNWDWHMYVVWNWYCLGDWNRVGMSYWDVSGNLDWYSVRLWYGNLLGDGVDGVDMFVLDGIDVMLSVNVGDVSLTSSQTISVTVTLNVGGGDWCTVSRDQSSVAQTI